MFYQDKLAIILQELKSNFILDGNVLFSLVLASCALESQYLMWNDFNNFEGFIVLFLGCTELIFHRKGLEPGRGSSSALRLPDH